MYKEVSYKIPLIEKKFVDNSDEKAYYRSPILDEDGELCDGEKELFNKDSAMFNCDSDRVKYVMEYVVERMNYFEIAVYDDALSKDNLVNDLLLFVQYCNKEKIIDKDFIKQFVKNIINKIDSKNYKEDLSLYSCLKELIELSKISQEKVKNNKLYSYTSYLKEYCLIELKTARQSGHTSSAIQLALEFDAKGKNVLYVCHNLDYAGRMSIKNSPTNIRFSSITSVKSFLSNCYRKNIDLVIVDPASICFSDSTMTKNEFLNLMVQNMNFKENCFVVLVG